MASGPRTVDGVKRSVLLQKELWKKNRYLAQARANVSGFGSLVGVFFAVAFACFAFISHQPWFIFAGLSVGSLVFAWQAIVSAERHLASVPLEWKLKAVRPFSDRLTHKVASLPTMPETAQLVADRTLAKYAQLVLACQIPANPPTRAALDDIKKIAEDAVMAALWDAPRLDGVLKAARARPKDLGVQMMARSMRHRFQLPAISIEAVTADLLAAISSGGSPDVNALRAVARDLADRLREPVPGSPEARAKKAKEQKDAEEAQEIEAVESGEEHRTLTGGGADAAGGASDPAPAAA